MRVFVVALACASCAPSAPPAPAKPAPAPSVELTLSPSTGDVWAWNLTVTGVAKAKLNACRVLVGDAEQPARIDEQRFTATVRLTPGTNVVEARCKDSAGRSIRSEQARFEARLRPVPRARIGAVADNNAVMLDGAGSTPNEWSRAAIVAFRWTAADKTLAEGPRLRADAKLLPKGRHTITLEVRDARNETDRVRAVVDVDATSVRIVSALTNASTVENTIVYGVVPPRFGTPPLRAVTTALPELADLGVNALWVSPITATPPGDYGYAVIDYFRVREDYGTKADLDALVTEAHRLGVRVLLDMVPNHTSAQHPYFVAAQKHGRQTHNWGYYDRDGSGAPTHYFDWGHLPNLNYDNPEVRRFMIEAFSMWTRDHNVDGFRVDAAWGIEHRAPSFWSEWAAEVRRIRPDAFLVAEASARETYWLAHGFDAAYDWTNELGHAAWEHVFDDPKTVVAQLDKALAAESAPRDRIFRFLDNNDTGPRFITRHGPGMTRAAAALLLTVPGIPCLFTGDERGAEWEPYGAAGVLPKTDPHDLRPWWKSLIAIRKSTKALLGGSFERLKSPPQTFAFMRRDDAKTHVALVAINFHEQPAKLSLPAQGASSWRERVSSKTLAAENGSVQVTVPAWGAVVLTPG